MASGLRGTPRMNRGTAVPQNTMSSFGFLNDPPDFAIRTWRRSERQNCQIPINVATTKNSAVPVPTRVAILESFNQRKIACHITTPRNVNDVLTDLQAPQPP